jgi:SAM-dependent methyltransferase
MPKPYEDNLAYIHDVGFGNFAIQAAPGLLATLAEQGIRDGQLVDLGCGTGLWAAAAARAGYDVLGIDISASMLAIARKRVPRATFRQGSFLQTKLPRANATTAIGEVFNYRFDQSVNDERLFRFFATVYAALVPGGLFIFDIAAPGRSRAAPLVRHWVEPDWALTVTTKEDTVKRELTRTMTTFCKVGKLYRRQAEVHRLRLYRPAEILSRLRGLGFRVRTVRKYGALGFPKGLTGFIARKPNP